MVSSPTPLPVIPAEVDHLVVGAGFGGIGAAIKLDEAGERDWLVVEKDDDVGGTWRANSYPGAACDVPSQLYSFSFAPNREWSMSFSPQPEIEAYIQRVAREAGILDRFRFGTRMESATWDEGALRWRVRLSRAGESYDVSARILLTGSGGLSEPRLPDIDGIDSFGGAIFHSARWDHSVDLTGKRIAVIGTGASAIQIIPELQKVAGRLDVHQRTAPYVIPRNGRTYSRLERTALRRVPGLGRAYRTGIYWGRELYVPAFAKQPRLAWPAVQMAKLNREKAIKDPDLLRKVTPTFQLGCKRVLISSTYYPALASPNVDVVTDRITTITPTGIVTADATGARTEREVDVIVVATGFQTTEQPIADHITGRNGVNLGELWRKEGMASYKGTTTRGFPNLFQLVGANTTLGHSSMVFMIESQLAYVIDAIRTMRAHRYAAVEPRQDAQDAWNDDLQRRLAKSVWNTGGCSSWYLDAHGRNTIIWPRTTFAFRRELAQWDPTAYDLVAG